VNRYFSDVLIIGGGVSGLACARALKELGNSSVIILEAKDKIGGRVATDYSDGFIFDNGFQVLIDGYPEIKRLGLLQGLGAASFAHGAIVRLKNKFAHLPDPFRQPSKALTALLSPALTFTDKLRLARLRMSTDKLSTISNETTEEYLQRLKFSNKAIQHFFRPFFGGVFLDNSLNTPSDKFKYLFRIFKGSNILLPEQGIGAISKSIATPLDPSDILLNRSVKTINRNSAGLGVVRTQDETFHAKVIVLTGANLEALLPKALSLKYTPSLKSVSCLYFKAESIPYPLNLPYLILNGNENETILHLCCLSSVQPSYAPKGSHLISVTVLDKNPNLNNSSTASLESTASIETSVRKELNEWFGKGATTWSLLKTFHIKHALPQGFPNNPVCADYPWLYRAGDYVLEATLNGALHSGKQVADEITKMRFE